MPERYRLGMTDSDQTPNTPDETRHAHQTTAPNATEADAAPRIDVTEQGDGVTRIDIRDDAAVRPGADPEETEQG